MSLLQRTDNSDGKCISSISPLEESKCKEKEDEKEIEETEIEEEARKVKVYRECKKPSQQEIEEHRVLHMPYKTWCPDCVMGRGLGARHPESSKRDDELRVPTIGADYCFLGDEQEEQNLTVLVMRDSKSGSTFGTVVQVKGGGCEWAVKRSIGFMDGLGYGKVVFKSDNEPSIVDLWGAIRIKRTADTVPENCPKGESQANGLAERAILELSGIARTLKVALERRIGVRLRATDAVIPWMIEHCGTLISRHKIGIDGLTPFERVKGKPNRKKMMEFGEVVLYMPVKSAIDKRRDKLNPKFEQGVWLGIHGRSNEDLVGTEQGVVRASVVKKVPEDERWCKESVMNIKGSPWKPRIEVEGEEDEGGDQEDREGPREEGPPDTLESEIPKVKRFYIRKPDILKYGLTPGCPGCTAIRNNQRAVSHNEKCRETITEKMEKSAEDEIRLAANRERTNEHIARMVEAQANKEEKTRHRLDEGDSERQNKKSRLQPREHSDSACPARSSEEVAQEKASSSSEVNHKKRDCEKDAESAKRRRQEENDEDDLLMLAERYNKKEHAKTSVIDLSSAIECEKARSMGAEAWTKRAVKSIRKLKPDLVIGGGAHATDVAWDRVYSEQKKVRGYFVHEREVESPQLAHLALDAQVASYYDAKKGRKMQIETNSPAIASEFAGRKLKDPCKTVRRSAINQMVNDRAQGKDVVMTMTADGRVWDDVRGGWLIESMVSDARKEEMEFVRRRGVYERRPYEEAKQRTGKAPIRLRWVDTNKGTPEVPNYRSRIVAMEVKKDNRLDLFAPTPPLEAMKLVVSNAASDGTKGREKVLMTIDIKRAYFYAQSIRETYVELPREDYEPGDEHKCGRLRLSLYGTRDAAMNWEAEIRATMESLGFQRGQASTCVYRHKHTGNTAAIHGDDILMEGSENELKEHYKKILKKYECTMSMIGSGSHLEKSLKILNRTIRWTEAGIEIEADKRHALEIIKEAKLEDNKKAIVPVSAETRTSEDTSWRCQIEGMSPIDRRSRGRVTAQDIAKAKQRREEEEPMEGEELTRYRGVAARVNYVSQDRADLKVAALQVCKAMSTPKTGDWQLIKKIARYLKHRPTAVCRYVWQDQCNELKAYSDSDWAGDRITRRSTSGGCILRGAHLIKCWAKNQHVIALSSAEAELYACVRTCSESLGVKSILKDMGKEVEITILVDATATMGMMMKEGLSGVRHIDTQHLWVQEKIKNKQFVVKKVKGEDNAADMFTKPLSADILEKHFRYLGFWI